MKVKSETEVAQLCPTLGDSMDCSLPGSSICGIFHARALEWGAIAFSRSHPSVQFGRSVMSDSLQPHESQHTRPPCPSPTPGVYSNSCPSSRWCHPATSSFVVPFSSCPQSLQASGSFQMSQFFASGGQNIGIAASASVLPMNISFRMDWLDLLAVQWTLKSLLDFL